MYGEVQFFVCYHFYFAASLNAVRPEYQSAYDYYLPSSCHCLLSRVENSGYMKGHFFLNCNCFFFNSVFLYLQLKRGKPEGAKSLSMSADIHYTVQNCEDMHEQLVLLFCAYLSLGKI